MGFAGVTITSLRKIISVKRGCIMYTILFDAIFQAVWAVAEIGTPR